MSSRRRATGTLLLALAAGLAGCGYPPVSSSAYEIARTLHGVLDRRSSEGLRQTRQLIVERRRSGQLPDADGVLLEEIIAVAESGDWRGAMGEVRGLLLDQNRPAKAANPEHHGPR